MVDLATTQAEIVAELRSEALALGLRWGGRNNVRKGTKAARLLGEIGLYRMMGTLLISRWNAHGVTYDDLRTGNAVMLAGRHVSDPVSAKVRIGTALNA